MSKFPDTPNFTGFYKPMRFEADVTDLEMEGELPADLDGAFFRVAPDPHHPPKLGDDIFFGGDGAATRFRIKNGKVDMKHRYVRTPKFEMEEKAGRALWGAYRNPLTDDESTKGVRRSTANTNVVEHAGKLWALKEDSPPVAMDLNTLETEGMSDFGGKLKSDAFTAHPKIDPKTGQMLAINYATKGLMTTTMSYVEIAPDGTLTKEIFFEAPYYCMVHDFGITDDFVVFPIMPCVGSWERLEAGLPHFGWDPSLPLYMGVLRRDDEKGDVRWFKAPAAFFGHVINSWNEGDKVYLDAPVMEGNGFDFFPAVDGSPFDPSKAVPIPHRFVFDMSSNSDSFERSPIAPIPGELPKVDDRYMGQAYRHAWYGGVDPSKPFEAPYAAADVGLFFMNIVVHQDLATGAPQTYWDGPSSIFQETCFVPRTPNSPEGDGFVVVLCNQIDQNRSDLLFLDATNIAAGPVARAKLPYWMRAGVHGSWCDGSKLAN